MVTTGLRIAEVLRQSGLITPSEVLQNLARTGRTPNQVSREAQALRNYREEAVNKLTIFFTINSSKSKRQSTV